MEGEQTKTSELRIIPLPDVLVETLKRARKKEAGVGGSGPSLSEK
jgi:hypothetical protein